MPVVGPLKAGHYMDDVNRTTCACRSCAGMDSRGNVVMVVVSLTSQRRAVHLLFHGQVVPSTPLVPL